MRTVVVPEYGSSDALDVRDADVPEPAPGEVRIAVEAAGINFADIMQRRGHYRNGPEPTYTPGLEAAGTIDAVGEGVEREVGERVVALTGGGAYAEYVTAPATALFDVPESMSSAEAAGFPVQFLTAYNCLHGWGELEAGERVLIHAAAGGVGTAAVQLASLADAETYGTASTEAKISLALDLGLDHGIQYTETDFRDVIAAETEDGVDLVLDGVGGQTFDRSLDALADFGRIVTYGAASGDVAKADTTRLLFENKSVVGFHLGNAMQKRPESVLRAVPELSKLLADGELEVVVGETFALEDAAEAHQYVEDRKSVGKVVLEP
ncbi:zinc-binding alcohol dehydrogenase family protein [Haloferax namakaokahaiae]|uniref:Zinc-binding alcohol dehydrogenase family protein n=1 Tax=Haloferax namakaokahaiae TaxID=1748331 RepID=A0ABD5ZFT8_9EURY